MAGGVYADRTAGGDCHHRDLAVAAIAGLGQGEGSGALGQLPLASAPGGTGAAVVARG